MRVLIAAALLCGGISVQAQQADRLSGVLRATVTDVATGTPVAGVEIGITGTQRSARTDSLGHATIDRLAPGNASVEARRLGFAPFTVQVTIGTRDTVDAVFALRSTATTLAKMTTIDSADSHSIPEFEARRKTHIGGYFVTEADIRKNQSSTIANLIRSKIPGVNPVVNPDRSTTLYSTRSVEKCRVLTFLDGVRMLEGDIGVVGLESLGAIEYYPPGYVPVQFRPPPAIEPPPKTETTGGRGTGPRLNQPATTQEHGPRAECGVLLLWTRR